MILSLNKKANTMKLVSLQRGMGFPIHTFEQLIDSVGGVDVELNYCMSFCMGVSEQAGILAKK